MVPVHVGAGVNEGEGEESRGAGVEEAGGSEGREGEWWGDEEEGACWGGGFDGSTYMIKITSVCDKKLHLLTTFFSKD